jgi:hypothetical protein
MKGRVDGLSKTTDEPLSNQTPGTVPKYLMYSNFQLITGLDEQHCLLVRHLADMLTHPQL